MSADLWRFLLPDDLGGFMMEALRNAPEVRLVATAAGPAPVDLLPVPFIGDVEYAADILRARLDLALTRHGPVTVLTLRRPGRA